MSRRVTSRDVDCPVCGALAGQRCRGSAYAGRGHRAVDYHTARREAAGTRAKLRTEDGVMIHANPHPLAGQTVRLGPTAADPIQRAVIAGAQYRVEDWWDRVAGMSWTIAQGNPAALQYALRAGFVGLPTDDEVVYGKIGSLGHLVHVSELLPQVTSPAVEGEEAGAPSDALRASPRPAATHEAGAPSSSDDEARVCVTGRPERGANAGKPGPTAEMHNPPPGSGGPAGPTHGEHRYAGYSGEHGYCSAHRRWENTPPEHDGTGPADDDLVWIAVRRRGIDAHRPDGPVETGCGRSMRCGEKLLASEARAGYQARWCHRCWPDQPGDER